MLHRLCYDLAWQCNSKLFVLKSYLDWSGLVNQLSRGSTLILSLQAPASKSAKLERARDYDTQPCHQTAHTDFWVSLPNFFFFFFIWVLQSFQEYFTYIKPIVNQRWGKTGVPGERPPDLLVQNLVSHMPKWTRPCIGLYKQLLRKLLSYYYYLIHLFIVIFLFRIPFCLRKI